MLIKYSNHEHILVIILPSVDTHVEAGVQTNDDNIGKGNFVLLIIKHRGH